MTNYPKTAVLQKNIYVGGGHAAAGNISENCTIQVYDVDKDKWYCLPKYSCRKFAMTIINSQLTLVGGYDIFTRKTLRAENFPLFHL